MKLLSKLFSLLLCLTFVFNLYTTAFASTIDAASDHVAAYTVRVVSNEYRKENVTFYEYKGKFYLDLNDIMQFTRCILTENENSLVLTHGLREIVIDKNSGLMVDSALIHQGEITLLKYNDMYLCEGIPMLKYLGATCSVRDNILEVLMPMFTIWEAIAPDYKNFCFDINQLYGGEDNVKISLICDVIADIFDGISGHGIFVTPDTHIEDALYEILNVDMMLYESVKETASEENLKINDLLSSVAYKISLETGDSLCDSVYELFKYYCGFYTSSQYDGMLDAIVQTDDLEYASELVSQIHEGIYSQYAAKENLYTTQNLQKIVDIGLVAFDVANTSMQMMKYDNDTRNLLAFTINERMFDYVDCEEFAWSHISDKISNKLKSSQSIVAYNTGEKVIEHTLKEATEKGIETLLLQYTAKGNIYLEAAKLGSYLVSAINYKSNQAQSADLNAIILSGVQKDISVLLTALLEKERSEFFFMNSESLEKLKYTLLLYYRTAIAFSENLAISIEEFGGKEKDAQASWFASKTEPSVANHAAYYLYRATNCTIKEIEVYKEIKDDIITGSWISKAAIFTDEYEKMKVNKVELTNDMQVRLNIFLSNFSEQGFNEFVLDDASNKIVRNYNTFITETAAPAKMIGFVTKHCLINNYGLWDRAVSGGIKPGQYESVTPLFHTYMTIDEITQKTQIFFGRSITQDEIAAAGYTIKEGRAYWDIFGMGETYNHMTVVDAVWEQEDGTYFVEFSIYAADSTYGAGPGAVLDKSVYNLTPTTAMRDPGVTYYMSGVAELYVTVEQENNSYTLKSYRLLSESATDKEQEDVPQNEASQQPENDGTPITVEELIGNWSIDGEYTREHGQQFLADYFGTSFTKDGSNLTFERDGSFSCYIGSHMSKGSFRANGDEIILVYLDENSSIIGEETITVVLTDKVLLGINFMDTYQYIFWEKIQ